MFDFDKITHDFVTGLGKVVFRPFAKGARYYYAEDCLYIVAYGNTDAGHTFKFVRARNLEELRDFVLEDGK